MRGFGFERVLCPPRGNLLVSGSLQPWLTGVLFVTAAGLARCELPRLIIAVRSPIQYSGRIWRSGLKPLLHITRLALQFKDDGFLLGQSISCELMNTEQ